MYEITTLSGTVYVIHNGRITRQGDFNPYLPPEAQHPVLNNTIVTLRSNVEIGRPLLFVTPAVTDTGVWRTSPITEIRFENGLVLTQDGEGIFFDSVAA